MIAHVWNRAKRTDKRPPAQLLGLTTTRTLLPAKPPGLMPQHNTPDDLARVSSPHVLSRLYLHPGGLAVLLDEKPVHLPVRSSTDDEEVHTPELDTLMYYRFGFDLSWHRDASPGYTNESRQCTPGLTEKNAVIFISPDGEHSLSTSAMLKRRIQALVLFVSTSLTPSELDAPTNGEGGNTTDVITHLLDLATPPTGDAPEDDVVTIVAAAQCTIERIMNVISAREFLGASPDDLLPRSKPERLASFPPGSRWSSKVCAKNVKQRLLNSLA
ncbi:hypothetical protein EV363DRAFT_1591856 [Boletus edulis]|nr:hypothetical protein EV363DRAFT_1591856 [Boletus edulis]